MARFSFIRFLIDLSAFFAQAVAVFLRPVIGEFSYKPPAWVRGFWSRARGFVKRHPGLVIRAVLGLTLAALLAWTAAGWWEAHRARQREIVPPREAVAKASTPADALIDDEGVEKVQPLFVRFDVSAAPLDLVGKPAEHVTLHPALPGRWTWKDDKTLVFNPEKPWPADVEFVARFERGAFPKEVIVRQREVKFRTRPVEARIESFKFYTNPAEPDQHEVVATIRSNRPLDPAVLESKITLAGVASRDLFNWKGVRPRRLFELTPGKGRREFFLRSARIQIPEREDQARLTIGAGLVSLDGGKGLAAEVTEKVAVPDKFSGFKIAGFRTEIISTDEGEPEQFLFVDTSGLAEPEAVGKNLAAWRVPDDWVRNRPLPASGAVDDAILAQWTPVKLERVETGEADGPPVGTTHAFKFFQPGSGTLFVRVRAGVAALGGFELARDAAQFVSIPLFPEEVSILGKGGLVALGGERKLGLKVRGVGHLRVSTARVPFSQVNHLAAMTYGDVTSPLFRSGYLFNEENIARYDRRIIRMPAAEEHQAVYPTLDLGPTPAFEDGSDPDNVRGLFFLRIEAVEAVRRGIGGADEPLGDPVADWRPDRDVPAESRFLIVSDLGLLAKRAADGSRDVFLQSIGQGVPVEGARILVIAKNGEFVAESHTDSEGHARLPDIGHLKREKEPVAIVARLGNDVSFLPFNRPQRALDFSRFDTGGIPASENERLDAFLFTERGIYRPGDEIHLGAMIRRRDWGGRLGGLPVLLQIVDSRGDVRFAGRAALPDDGFIDFTAPTEEANPTGIHTATLFLTRGGSERIPLGSARFRVEDFQPDRMKMTLDLPGSEAEGWIPPQAVRAALKIETLFGFPAAGRRIKARIELQPARFAFPKFEGFLFHNRNEERSGGVAGQTIDLGERKTDDSGRAEFDLALERFADASFRLDFLAEGFEPDGGRSVRGGRSVLVSPFPFVLGYRPDGDLGFIGKDAARKIRLIAIDGALNKTEVAGLTWRAVEIRHVSVLTKQPDDTYAYISTRRERVASEGPLDLPSDGADFDLPTGAAGEFRLELRDRDNRVLLACPFTVVGKGEAGRSLERDAELEVRLARPEWRSGEEIELSVRAPFTGSGLITIERERVLAWEWFRAGTTSSIQRIRVPEGIEGTHYINVSFVRDIASPEVFMSPLSYAAVPFTANPEKRRLAVALDAPATVRPGKPLRIGFSTERPARIAIWAVDAGIHQITDYTLPRPGDFLGRKRALEVSTEQILDLLLPEFSLLKGSKAFGGGESPPRLHINPFQRRKDPPVVFWSGIIESGPERREVVYDVPDYFAGTLNVMAVAAEPAATGQAEGAVVVRGPMVLTSNVPLFVAPGDEFLASLTVANNLETPGPAAIRVEVAPDERLEILSGNAETLDIEKGAEGIARFRLRAAAKLGGSELRFQALAGEEEMERRATLSVRPASPFLTVARSGWFRTRRHEVVVGREMFPQFRRLEAQVSALPLGLAAGLEKFLAANPWGCSEQITSRAMGRLLLANEVDFGFDKAESARAIDSAIARLRSRQHAGGGFGYWDSSAEEEPAADFLSVYAGLFLVEARDLGHAVPGQMLDGLRARLREIARARTGSFDNAANQAIAIYLLARLGEMTANELLNLRDTLQREHPDRWLGDLCAPCIAGTYALLQKGREGEALIRSHRAELSKPDAGRVTGDIGDYHLDPDMRRALGFSVICREFPELARTFGYDDLAPIMRPIEAWRVNTISAAASILALKNYSKAVTAAGVRTAIHAHSSGVGQTTIAQFAEGMSRAAFEPGTEKIVFELDQAGTDLGAFYQTVEAGFDLAPPAGAIRDGLEVTRELVNASGQPLASLKVGEGAELRIRIRNISGRPLRNLAVLDLLPGGFEIEANALRPGRATLPGTDFVEVREDRNVLFLGLDADESRSFSYRIKPVAAGLFTLPPAQAESMYDPSIKGRSEAGRIEVRQAQ